MTRVDRMRLFGFPAAVACVAAATALGAPAGQPVKSAPPPARPAAQAPARPPQAPAQAAQPKAATPARPTDAPVVLWDRWYTVTVNRNIRYAYYNEHVETREGRVHFQSRLWKQEEGFVNEEHLGAFAANDAAVTPLFYNFYSTYRTTETKIDGTVEGGKRLKVRIRKGKTDLPIVNQSLPENTIFSTFFPVWLGRNVPRLKVDQPYSFFTVLEDNLELNFKVIPVQVRVMTPDAYAVRTNTRRIAVRYDDLDATWWVTDVGAAYRIAMSKQKTVIQQVKRELAETFFEEEQ